MEWHIELSIVVKQATRKYPLIKNDKDRKVSIRSLNCSIFEIFSIITAFITLTLYS